MNNRFSRQVETEDAKPSILIICEGEKTEPNYFSGFRLKNVKVKGTGYNTVSLVNFALKFKEEYDEVWCVFDQDGHINNFDSAIAKCTDNVRAAYTNEAFELWYLLHFIDIQAGTGITRDQYFKKLNRYLVMKRKKDGPKYCKKDPDVYEKLLPKQDTAIKRAKALMEYYGDHLTNSQKKPITTVHYLVERLNEFL